VGLIDVADCAKYGTGGVVGRIRWGFGAGEFPASVADAKPCYGFLGARAAVFRLRFAAPTATAASFAFDRCGVTVRPLARAFSNAEAMPLERATSLSAFRN
jgi:hypothetical protein